MCKAPVGCMPEKIRGFIAGQELPILSPVPGWPDKPPDSWPCCTMSRRCTGCDGGCPASTVHRLSGESAWISTSYIRSLRSFA